MISFIVRIFIVCGVCVGRGGEGGSSFYELARVLGCFYFLSCTIDV